MLLEELRYIVLQKKFALDFASYINPIRPGRGVHPPPRFFLSNFVVTKVIFLKICGFSPLLTEKVRFKIKTLRIDLYLLPWKPCFQSGLSNKMV